MNISETLSGLLDGAELCIPCDDCAVQAIIHKDGVAFIVLGESGEPEACFAVPLDVLTALVEACNLISQQ